MCIEEKGSDFKSNFSPGFFRITAGIFFLAIVQLHLACSVKMNSGNSAASSGGSGSSSSSTPAIGPEILGVTATNADGVWGTGTTLTLEVEFESIVNVDLSGGTPYITLAMDSTNRNATYASGTGTDTLSFTYTVVNGDATSDLDFNGPTAFSLNGGSILGANGGAAVLDLAATGAAGSISDNQAVVVSGDMVIQLGDTANTNSTEIDDVSSITIMSSVTVDSDGYIYMAGRTFSDFNDTHSAWDALVIKLNPDGSIVWVKHLGTAANAATTEIDSVAGNEYVNGIAVDSSGNVYAAGYTSGGFNDTNGGSNDAFMMKLDSSGNVTWVRHFGTNANAATTEIDAVNGDDQCLSIDVDDSGNAYCGGSTTGSFNDTNGGGSNTDILVIKVDTNGNLTWVKQIGTTANAASTEIDAVNGHDICNSIKVDGSGNIFCGGITESDLNDTHGSTDAFVMKLNSSGNVVWVTHLGSNANTASTEIDDISGVEYCNSIDLDSSGNIYCGGHTQSNLNDTTNGQEAMIFKLNSSGTLQWVKHFGTNANAATTEIDNVGSESIKGLAVDGDGNIFAGGNTYSSLNDTCDGAAEDVFILKLDSDGDLQWINHYGTTANSRSTEIDDTTGNDNCNGLAVDSDNKAYCAGATNGAFNDSPQSNDPLLIKVAR